MKQQGQSIQVIRCGTLALTRRERIIADAFFIRHVAIRERLDNTSATRVFVV